MSQNKKGAYSTRQCERKGKKDLFVVLLALILLVMAFILLQPSPESDFFKDGSQNAHLINVSDGDTAWFEMGGREYKVRFLGIDTPEMEDADRALEALAKEAESYVGQKLGQADSIVLEGDPGSDIYDNYDRLLAWVWVDGVLLNEKLVEEGLATVRYIYGDYKYTGRLYAAQDRAKDAGTGVWGE